MQRGLSEKVQDRKLDLTDADIELVLNVLISAGNTANRTNHNVIVEAGRRTKICPVSGRFVLPETEQFVVRRPDTGRQTGSTLSCNSPYKRPRPQD